MEFTFAAARTHRGSPRLRLGDGVRLLRLEPPDAPGWPDLRENLGTIRGYILDHKAMAAPSP